VVEFRRRALSTSAPQGVFGREDQKWELLAEVVQEARRRSVAVEGPKVERVAEEKEKEEEEEEEALRVVKESEAQLRQMLQGLAEVNVQRAVESLREKAQSRGQEMQMQMQAAGHAERQGAGEGIPERTLEGEGEASLLEVETETTPPPLVVALTDEVERQHILEAVAEEARSRFYSELMPAMPVQGEEELLASLGALDEVGRLGAVGEYRARSVSFAPDGVFVDEKQRGLLIKSVVAEALKRRRLEEGDEELAEAEVHVRESLEALPEQHQAKAVLMLRRRVVVARQAGGGTRFEGSMERITEQVMQDAVAAAVKEEKGRRVLMLPKPMKRVGTLGDLPMNADLQETRQVRSLPPARGPHIDGVVNARAGVVRAPEGTSGLLQASSASHPLCMHFLQSVVQAARKAVRDTATQASFPAIRPRGAEKGTQVRTHTRKTP
jgi:hypothetical protein